MTWVRGHRPEVDPNNEVVCDEAAGFPDYLARVFKSILLALQMYPFMPVVVPLSPSGSLRV